MGDTDKKVKENSGTEELGKGRGKKTMTKQKRNFREGEGGEEKNSDQVQQEEEESYYYEGEKLSSRR